MPLLEAMRSYKRISRHGGYGWNLRTQTGSLTDFVWKIPKCMAVRYKSQ